MEPFQSCRIIPRISTTGATPRRLSVGGHRSSVEFQRYKNGKIVPSQEELATALNNDGQIVLLTLGYMLTCTLVIAIWYSLDRPKSIDIISSTEETLDSNIITYIHICYAKYIIFWIFGICIALCGIIGWALWILVQIYRNYSVDESNDVKMSMLVLVNVAFSFSGCVVNYFLNSGSLFQDLTIALFFSIYCITSTFILFNEKILALWKFMRKFVLSHTSHHQNVEDVTMHENKHQHYMHTIRG